MENKGEKTTVERWNVSAFLDFMGKMEKLKSVPRHCVTSDGVTEVVAAHCWRMALMALMLKDEIPEVDMDKVIHMCLLHDIGEAVTGDIPSFEKTQKHEKTEKEDFYQKFPLPTEKNTKICFRRWKSFPVWKLKFIKR